MSDSITSGPRGLIVGTAGHIDHGKTALVRALTGMDTDRLAEEKRRGISIDLGFAHLTLQDGRRVSFIDVPGHERFIRNMLAGAAGIEAVLLVVAADESVKPQTREHFDICRLLGLQRGLIVLTKVDLASAEQLQKTISDVRELCRDSFLADAPIIPVSAVSGAGLDELRVQLAWLAAQQMQRDHTGLARLPIDRAFALKGFGTVVTGTLWSGTLRTGDTVQLHPSNREARIRGLQVHGRAVEAATAGQRTAANLAGVDHSEISRGFVLTHPRQLETTMGVDVSVDWLDDSEMPAKRGQFLFHIGTAEVMGSFKPLKAGLPLGRVTLAEAVIALPGDRFILRQPSPPRTVAGGTVIEAFPPKRINRAKTLERLEALRGVGLSRRLQLLVEESANGRAISELVKLTGATPATIHSTLQQNAQLVYLDSIQQVVAKGWIELRRQKLVAWLKAFHSKNPAAAGAPISQARLGLNPAFAAVIFDGFSAIRVHGDAISLAAHQAQISDQQSQALAKIEYAFRQAGYQPPPPAEILRAVETDPKKARTLLESLIKGQKLVRLSDDLVFHAEIIAHIRRSLAAHKGRRFSVPDFKAWTNVSRKYAIPLLEYLDHQRVTRREGDERVVL